MNADRHRVGVTSFGSIPDITAKVVAAHISGFLNLEAICLAPMKKPVFALDKQRLQYDAGALLQYMEKKMAASADKVIGILDGDLFLPVFTHVIGQARQGGRVGIISLFRLREKEGPTTRPSAVELERTAKVALHELCHLYGLTHCDSQKCLMHFSGSVADLDELPINFCRYCRQYFRDSIK